MNRWIVGGALMVMLAGGAGVAGTAGSAGSVVSKLSPRVTRELQAALDAWAADSAHLGVSAAVVLRNGTEWVSTAGSAGAGRPLTPAHLIWIASITKTMTAAVIMQLAQEHVLGLDDPVSRWLGTIENVDPRITIRQLLNHTNGLANYTSHPNLVTLINADTTHRFTPQELVPLVGPKSFERGERTQYTNSSFLLLGMIAEKATRTPIMQLYHERLWGPLGLEDIFLPAYEEPAGPVARTWVGRPGAVEERDPLEMRSLITLGYSAFGLFSSARTVARWGRALFTGNVISDSMRAQMLEFVPAAGNIPGESGAGLGIRRYGYLGREQWGHSGGSPGGSSLMFHDPVSGITLAVLMNQGAAAQHFVLAERLLVIVAGN